jgi:MoxR-like ATPase
MKKEQNLGMIPLKDETFVPYGSYSDVKTIMESGVFLPIFLTGPSRSGKTLIPQQICAELGKNLYRVNITVETDESDLLGSYKLIDGNTIWEDGPVIKAAEDPSGAKLLLDELDLASDKVLCLQPILEGTGIYIKKINRWVKPNKGFNIIATANTKGRGDDEGKYKGANLLNGAMLERFPITYTQDYPDKKTEELILKKNLKLLNIESPDFVEKLCQWAENIRKTKAGGGVDETISTGKLVYIVKTYAIFGRNRVKAIKDNIGGFDINTQASFLDVYLKIDDNAVDGSDEHPAEQQATKTNKVPW